MEELKLELKRLIIATLKLDDLTPEQMEDTAPLFGDEGLGLDSIDALELSVALEKHYGVTIPDRETGQRVYACLESLARHVLENRKNP